RPLGGSAGGARRGWSAGGEVQPVATLQVANRHGGRCYPRGRRTMSAVLVTDHDGGVRVLTLNRPPANAINEELLADLCIQLDAARQDNAVRALVVTGAGKFFGAGFDFSAPPRDATATVHMNTIYRDAP